MVLVKEPIRRVSEVRALAPLASLARSPLAGERRDLLGGQHRGESGLDLPAELEVGVDLLTASGDVRIVELAPEVEELSDPLLPVAIDGLHGEPGLDRVQVELVVAHERDQSGRDRGAPSGLERTEVQRVTSDLCRGQHGLRPEHNDPVDRAGDQSRHELGALLGEFLGPHGVVDTGVVAKRDHAPFRLRRLGVPLLDLRDREGLPCQEGSRALVPPARLLDEQVHTFLELDVLRRWDRRHRIVDGPRPGRRDRSRGGDRLADRGRRRRRGLVALEPVGEERDARVLVHALADGRRTLAPGATREQEDSDQNDLHDFLFFLREVLHSTVSPARVYVVQFFYRQTLPTKNLDHKISFYKEL